MTIRDPAAQAIYDLQKRVKNPMGYPDFLSFVGSGSPEGVVTAPVGSQYRDASADQLYNKATGTGNTGWVAA